MYIKSQKCTPIGNLPSYFFYYSRNIVLSAISSFSLFEWGGVFIFFPIGLTFLFFFLDMYRNMDLDSYWRFLVGWSILFSFGRGILADSFSLPRDNRFAQYIKSHYFDKMI